MSREKFDEAAHDQSLNAQVHQAAEQDVRPVPFDRSYWIMAGRFLAGAYPGDPVREAAEKKLQAFLAAGIRCFVDLTSKEERNLYGQPLLPYDDLVAEIAAGHFRIAYRRIPIPDLRVPTRAGMEEILDFIDGAIISDLPVYVHCLGGAGRTGTVVGCWLVRHGVALGEDAMDCIRRLRRSVPYARIPSPETAVQRQFIFEWNRGD